MFCYIHKNQRLDQDDKIGYCKPCPQCLEKTYLAGHQKGYELGHKDGFHHAKSGKAWCNLDAPTGGGAA